MKTEKIAEMFKALAILCLLAGFSGCMTGITMYMHHMDAGVIVLLCSFFAGISGFITNYAIANMMEAIDSIAQTNLRIANALYGGESNDNTDNDE